MAEIRVRCLAALTASAVAVAVALSGCSLITRESESTPTPAPSTSTPAPSEAPPEVDLEALQEDLDTAVAATDEFWSTHWTEYFSGAYTPPTVVGLYDGKDPESAPTCGGEPLVPNNAFYCFPDDFLAWDVNLMASGYRIGDAWPYLVVAHEWGHAVQARVQRDLVAQQAELQADCLAGAALFGAAEDGILAFEEGDQAEIAQSLSVLGDETPWTDSGDHGDPFQRIDFFDHGRQDGVPACFPTG